MLRTKKKKKKKTCQPAKRRREAFSGGISVAEDRQAQRDAATATRSVRVCRQV